MISCYYYFFATSTQLLPLNIVLSKVWLQRHLIGVKDVEEGDHILPLAAIDNCWNRKVDCLGSPVINVAHLSISWTTSTLNSPVISGVFLAHKHNVSGLKHCTTQHLIRVRCWGRRLHFPLLRAIDSCWNWKMDYYYYYFYYHFVNATLCVIQNKPCINYVKKPYNCRYCRQRKHSKNIETL